MHRRTTALLATAITGALVLSACAEDDADGGGTTTAPATASDTVRVVDNAFEPATTEVTAGDTVTWTWEGRTPHNVVGDGFDSGIQDEGTFSHTFEDAGTYDYECTLHAGMTGSVTVVEG